MPVTNLKFLKIIAASGGKITPYELSQNNAFVDLVSDDRTIASTYLHIFTDRGFLRRRKIGDGVPIPYRFSISVKGKFYLFLDKLKERYKQLLESYHERRILASLPEIELTRNELSRIDKSVKEMRNEYLGN